MNLPTDGWPEPIPDGIEPIVGCRMWGYALTNGRGELHSLNCYTGGETCSWEGAGSSWVVASCMVVGDGIHLPPDENCTCGFYAMSELPRLLAEAPVPPSVRGLIRADEDDMLVLGRVELAGKVIEHEYGYRAERARIAELLPFEGTERDVMRVANRLGLPIGRPVDLRSIEPAAFGGEVEIKVSHYEVADGSSAKEIAESLYVSPDTVEGCLHRIVENLDARGGATPLHPWILPSGSNHPASPGLGVRSWLARLWSGASSN